MSKAEIFKYQRSQFPRLDRCLIYNKSRSIMGEFDCTDELTELFDTYGEKFYATGKYNATTQQVMIDDLAPQQNW